MADLKKDIIQNEAASDGSGQKKKGGFKRHCARFWWAYLLGFVIIVVLVVVLVIFVAVPKIAQQKLDESELTIDGIAVTETQPDSYHLSINSTIRSDGKVHATIRGFTGVMYLEDLEPHTPFSSVDFPETSSDALQTVNVSERVTVSGSAPFTTFNTWLLHNETLRVTIRGDTAVRVRGIARDYPVTYSKTVTLKGLQGFAGLNVTSAAVSVEPDANGDNFRGWVDIPNHSIFTIEIGNATFINFLNGQDIGTTRMDNLILYPGVNNVSMRASVEQVPVLTTVAQRPFCESGILPFQLQGEDVVNRGQRLEYFARALAAANQTVDINMGAALKNSLNITVQCNP